jgi:hypothetical protein
MNELIINNKNIPHIIVILLLLLLNYILEFFVGAGNFSLHHRVQNGSGAHPASYPMGIRGYFPGGKAAGALS